MIKSTKRGFTLVEIAVGAGVFALLLAIVATGAAWLRNAGTIMEQIDSDAQLLFFPRMIHHSLKSSRELLYPHLSPEGQTGNFRNQLIFRDSTGDLCMLFLDQHGRLVQYSHSREQFRDILMSILEFKVRRLEGNLIEYELKIPDKEKEPKIVHGFYQIPHLKEF